MKILTHPIHWILLGMMIIIVILLQPALSWAQFPSSQLDYRLRRVEVEVNELRRQISQLQFQGVPVPASPTLTPDGNSPAPRQLSGDPMFDRLATLVIELKQDVILIQERLEKLEGN